MNITWWESPKNETHKNLVDTVKAIRNNQGYRKDDNLRHARLYGNMDIVGLSSYAYSVPNPGSFHNRVTLNVVQAVVDTVVSKIATSKPRPTFLTDGGNWTQQQRAKKLGKFIWGAFEGAKIYELDIPIFRDAGVFGTGVTKHFIKNGRICSERTLPEEIIVDDNEALYGNPRNLYQEKYINKDVLKSMFPKFKKEIDALKTEEVGAATVIHRDHSNLVRVIEGWHLPSAPDKGDGRHTVVIDTATLMDKEWKLNRFPFSKYCWNPKLFGWWGQGMAEQLTGIQIEINKLLRNMQVAHHLLSAPAVYVQNGSKINGAHLNNEIGRIVNYTGAPPEVKVFQTVHPELYQHLERLYQKAFEVVGVSQLSAQAKKPDGLDSGKALREFSNIQTERFLEAEKRWEHYHLDVADCYIQLVKQQYEDKSDFTVMAKGKDFIETIKWSEVDMKEDQYIMQTFPVSSLPKEPAGRIAYVQELMQSGLVDPEAGTELLDFPDVEAHMKHKFAPQRLAKDAVDKILEDGKSVVPEPFMDLDYAVEYAGSMYALARLENAPDDRLDKLLRFIENAQAMISQAEEEALAVQQQQMMAQQPPQPGQAPVGAAPQAPVGELQQFGG